jgi:hypothetical protein
MYMNQLSRDTGTPAPAAGQRDLNPVATPLFREFADCIRLLQQDPSQRDTLLAGLTAQYQASKGAVISHGIVARGPGCASFTAPVGISIEASWEAFSKDLNLGRGSEIFGFTDRTRPEWFPKNPGDTVTIGASAARVDGSERLSRAEQAELDKTFSLRLATPSEVVEVLVAERLVTAAQNVATFETFKNTADWMDADMLSPEVLQAVINQESASRGTEPLSAQSLSNWRLAGSTFEDANVQIALATRPPPE